MKLLITGGHLTPALAVIDEIQSTKNSVQILFVGRRYTSERSKEETFEYKEIKKRGIPFIHLKAGRFSRVFAFDTLFHLLRTPGGFYQAYRVLRKYKPDRVLSFGGYIALPVAVMASFLKIPVFTHEQTIHPGLSNKIISRYARKIFLSFEQSKKYFKKKNVIVSGNPVRKQMLEAIEKPFQIKKTRPVIYITGGSLGSHAINALIEQILPELLEDFIIIHQTGNVKKYADHDRLQIFKHTFHEYLQKRYYLVEHFTTEELGYIYSISDFVIGRSGANTFFELLMLKKPAIFIPLPWSAHKEQEKQAQLYKKWGLGEVFYQNHKSAELLELIKSVSKNLYSYQENFSHTELTYAKDATKIIIKTVVG